MIDQIENIYEVFKNSTGIFTDTRKPLVGGVFLSLKGQSFNGNKYASKAIQQGAFRAIVDDYSLSKKDNKFIYVKDSLEVLKNLANYHRKRMTCPVIAITGSNGKTTTKELLKVVLEQGYNTHATKGNLNNHIGVPLTILNTPLSSEFTIIEMGANHLKEIEELCEIAEPTHGFITNFGKAHIEGFGSKNKIIEGKSELYNYLSNSNGIIFLNIDNENQVKKIKKIPFVSFGQNKKSDYQVSYSSIDNKLELKFKAHKFKSSLHGEYNFQNIAAAIVIGNYFKIPINKIQNAIRSYKSTNNRSQLIKLKNHKIILDAYNANPSSMEVAIKSFKKSYPNDNLLILGDMLELGSFSIKAHKEIIDLGIKLSFSRIITVGLNFDDAGKKFPQIDKFISNKKLTAYLKDNDIKQKNILIKGSRSMELEKILIVL
jgi:UDP-N-acetylmuramoyl-tripeptide--D-alanyl-D-alanine ligase